jgi:hypothetical protein
MESSNLNCNFVQEVPNQIDALLEEQMILQANAIEDNQIPQAFQSDFQIFNNLPKDRCVFSIFYGISILSLKEGWNVRIISSKRDPVSNFILFCTLHCFMYDKNSKRSAKQKHAPKRAIKSAKTM